ncbi:MAG: carbohydrate kinase [Calditrichaeota bacterium]|nr:MAG: carbohydrate kinase [Calditrichota bacterium]
MKIDVLCIGATSHDLYFTIPHDPKSDEKMVADQFISCGGGPASNAAMTVSQLGHKSAFAGYLGNDFYGETHHHELADAGVITDFIVHGDKATPLSVILVKPNGERLLVNYTESQDKIPSGSIDFDNVEAKVILCDGHEPDISLPLLKSARKRRTKSILDAGSVHRGTRMLLNQVDYLICSEKFAIDYTPDKSSASALKKLAQNHARVIITMGKAGLIWKANSETGIIPAFEIEAIDSTGAGDVFHGAFASCLVEERSWDFSLKFASAAAALSCRYFGGRPKLPPKCEILKFMRQA